MLRTITLNKSTLQVDSVWYALKVSDTLWRTRFKLDRLLTKARLFAIALPRVCSVAGGGGESSVAVGEDDLSGVDRDFYVYIFTLKVHFNAALTPGLPMFNRPTL